MREPTVMTVGHSSRTLSQFLRILEPHGVGRLVDVRRFPGSRRSPHFGAGALAHALQGHGIEYEHLVDLGGHREPRTDSSNMGLRHPSFRGYADYMNTPAFSAALDRLLAMATERRTAIMCAEADWHRCHRRLLADAILARGARVFHLLDEHRREPHVLEPPAIVADGRVWYPAGRLF